MCTQAMKPYLSNLNVIFSCKKMWLNFTCSLDYLAIPNDYMYMYIYFSFQFLQYNFYVLNLLINLSMLHYLHGNMIPAHHVDVIIISM